MDCAKINSMTEFCNNHACKKPNCTKERIYDLQYCEDHEKPIDNKQTSESSSITINNIVNGDDYLNKNNNYVNYRNKNNYHHERRCVVPFCVDNTTINSRLCLKHGKL